MRAGTLLIALVLVGLCQGLETPPAPKLQSGFGNFLVGIFEGFQASTSHQSLCVMQLHELTSNMDDLFLYLMSIFSNYVYVFQSLNEFANFMDSFDQAVKSCEFSRLLEQITALKSTGGKAAIVARVAIKSQSVIDDWKTFYYNLVDGNYEGAGAGLGGILSVVLNFSI